MYLLRDYSMLWWVVLVLGSFHLTAQNTDLIRLEYTYIPQTLSENNFLRARGFVNLPIKLNEEGSYLIPGFEFRSTTLDLQDAVPFTTENLRDFQMYRIGLGYVFSLSDQWRLAFRTGFEVASNFERRSVQGDDMRFSGAAYAVRSRTSEEFARPSRLIVGLQYSTNAGMPFPLPIINYYREFHPNWSYSLGTPKTNIKWHISKKHKLQAFISLDGFFSNIQTDFEVTDPDGSTGLADTVSMTLVLSALGYEYYFTKHILFYFYGGYTLFNEIRLRDSSRNSVYKFNTRNAAYFRSGFKLKI